MMAVAFHRRDNSPLLSTDHQSHSKAYFSIWKHVELSSLIPIVSALVVSLLSTVLERQPLSSEFDYASYFLLHSNLMHIESAPFYVGFFNTHMHTVVMGGVPNSRNSSQYFWRARFAETEIHICTEIEIEISAQRLKFGGIIQNFKREKCGKAGMQAAGTPVTSSVDMEG